MDLEPWLVLITPDNSSETELALWHPENQSSQALAVFSSEERALVYGNDLDVSFRVTQFKEEALIRVLIACVQREIQYAALDPGSSESRTLFDLREVLRAARDQLAAKRLQL